MVTLIKRQVYQKAIRHQFPVGLLGQCKKYIDLKKQMSNAGDFFKDYGDKVWHHTSTMYDNGTQQ